MASTYGSRSVTQVLFPRVVFLAGATLIGSAGAALAGPFWLETNVSINTGCTPGVSCLSADDPVNLEFWGPIPDPGGVSLGSGLLTVNQTYGAPGAQLTASAQTNANYGALQVAASADYDLTGVSTPELRFVVAGAQSTEQITVPGTGTGTFVVSLGLDGLVQTSGSANAGVLLVVQWDSSLSPDGDHFYTFFGTQTNTPITQSIPIVFGQPFTLGFFMAAAAGTIAPCGVGDSCEFGINFAPQNDLGYGSADFFHTLEITGLAAYDAAGNLLPDAQFIGASGTHYTAEGVVPEPSLLLLLGGGGIALGLRRWSRRGR